MSRPKISFITCSYNRPAMLREAVESLRAQTDQDWEHLIYDDASTDPGVEAALRWVSEDPRVRVWRGLVNRDQPAKLWNFLLDRALGRYICTLDDDCTKLPDFVEVMTGELDRDPTAGAVTCGFWVVDERGRRCQEHRSNVRTSAEVLDQGNTCDGGAIVYRREMLASVGYFAEDLRTNEDWDWIRRAAHLTKIKNFDLLLATYRNHSSNRMWRSDALGSDADIARMRARSPWREIGVTFLRPPDDRLTESQRDVAAAIDEATGRHPRVRRDLRGDLAVVAVPFRLSPEEIAAGASGCTRAVSVHVEDPYALHANLERVRALAAVVPETWVATNDASTVGAYASVVEGRVLVYPSLSAPSREPIGIPGPRSIDVLFCGHPYPSRRRFVEDLLPRLGGLRVVLVGDGWEEFASRDVQVHRTLPLEDAYALHRIASTVICAHRVDGDCGGSPLPPRTVNRGYMEGRGGGLVLLDRSRDHHHLSPGDVEWYDGPADCAERVRAYLASPTSRAEHPFADKCRTLYTHEVRIGRIINSVLANRRLAEIP